MNNKFPTILNKLTPANIRFLKDMNRLLVTTAGRRSRKTLIADYKMLVDPGRGAMWLPEHTYIFAAPTHDQARNIYWDKLDRMTKVMQSRKPNKSERKIFLKNGSQLYIVGLDKPERIEGITYPPIKAIHITEFDNTKDGLWGNNIRPILSDNNGWAIFDGVPEGRDKLYDFANDICDGNIPKTIPMQGAHVKKGEWSFHSWFSSDILPQKEIEAAKRDLDDRTFRQEYEGSFETFEGLAYYAYSEKNNADCKFIPGYPLAIGMDFNVNPMCAVEGHLKGNAYFQHGESILRQSNTEEMVLHIINKYKLTKDTRGKYNVIVYPDSTGKALHTNAKISDLQILLKMGFQVKAKTSNPHQKDRINSVNSAMRPISGQPKYFVNPLTCKNTIDNFNKVGRLSDGRLDKTQEKEGSHMVHLTDALGYLIDYNFPIRANTGFYVA